MKKTILVFVAGIFMCLSSATNAATTTESKDASATKTEVKSNIKEAHTYYVTGVSGDNYVLSDAPSELCNQGTSAPCQITTDEDYSSTMEIDQDLVDQQDGVKIETRRPPF